MSLDNIEVIDAIGLETSTNTVVLSILDPMDWSNEHEHLNALQAKINSYFGFIETGQILEAYPDAREKALRIDVIARHSPLESALQLITKASEIAGELNATMVYKVHSAI
jgi:hypothetical protein